MLIALCFMLGIACYFDYRKGRIPNLLLIFMLISGEILTGICGKPQDMIWFLLKSVVVVLILYPVFRIGALGAGDVKLYGICAGYLPRNKFLFFLFFSLLIAAVISLIKIMVQKSAAERFGYFCEYVAGVARSGKFYLYIEDAKERKTAGICLAGPILGSLLLYLGGVY